MNLSVAEATAHIAHYSRVLADAARDNLAARVEHCPDWTVADLVHHVTEVHWFWSTIAAGPLSAPPDEPRPNRAPDDRLVDTFLDGAAHLVRVLADADQSAPCWTWSPPHQHVGFITRHQVQEAAVHAFDAVNAAGGTLAIEPGAAADAVDEFLTVSLADEEDAEREELTPLDGTLAIRASDTGDAWSVTDGPVPGSAATTRGAADGAPEVSAPASDLLLWLYRRTTLDSEAPADLLERFFGLSSTD
jgi:uncharacterized protein (TIGR03083 family)